MPKEKDLTKPLGPADIDPTSWRLAMQHEAAKVITRWISLSLVIVALAITASLTAYCSHPSFADPQKMLDARLKHEAQMQHSRNEQQLRIACVQGGSSWMVVPNAGYSSAGYEYGCITKETIPLVQAREQRVQIENDAKDAPETKDQIVVEVEQ